MYVILWFLCCLIGFSQGDPRSSAIISALQTKYYNQGGGLWNTAGWWNSANSLEALVEYITYSNDKNFINVIDNVFSHTTIAQTRNGYFDDAGWWGIAWMRSYELTNDSRFLQRAQQIFDYILTDGWDSSHCGGGVWWSSAKNYKNAIPNELFLVLCTLLYNADPSNSTYLDYAKREWQWFENSGMINGQNLINDGLDNSCNNNKQTTWTYNQGVILGGLANLAKITQNNSLITIATNIANAATSTLVYSDGVLKESCEPKCGDDGDQFKGIFVRYLAMLTKQLSDQNAKSKFSKWISNNADSIWSKDKSNDELCGLVWNGPNNQAETNAITQSSALDCFNAVQSLSY